MSDPYPSKVSPPSQPPQEPQPELKEHPLDEYTDNVISGMNPTMETNLSTPLAAETGEIIVESQIQKVCKTMCVTTMSSLMVIAWASSLMLFSGLSSYWLLTTWPFFRVFAFLEWCIYPMTAALVLALVLSPVFAVVGDVLCGNFRLLLAGVIPLNIIGIIVTGALGGIGLGLTLSVGGGDLLTIAVVRYLLL